MIHLLITTYIKSSIELLGVLEPLLVNRKTNVIISGNLRHRIAVELGLSRNLRIFKMWMTMKWILNQFQQISIG